MNVLDEIFGRENFCAVIPFKKKTMPFGAKLLEQMYDFILWYAKDKPSVKYRTLFKKKKPEGDFNWRFFELENGSVVSLSSDQQKDHALLPGGGKLFRLNPLEPSGYNKSGMFSIEFCGAVFTPPERGWGTDETGAERIKKSGRLYKHGKSIGQKLFFDDYAVSQVTSPWDDVSWSKFSESKDYVVQTSSNVIQRCILMTTDPGDLVFDPTCGAGTTAFSAEKWGRRWITCDTSRVAMTLAKQRLMTASFDYLNSSIHTRA